MNGGSGEGGGCGSEFVDDVCVCVASSSVCDSFESVIVLAFCGFFAHDVDAVSEVVGEEVQWSFDDLWVQVKDVVFVRVGIGWFDYVDVVDFVSELW